MNANTVKRAFYVCRLLSDTKSKEHCVYAAINESSDLISNLKILRCV